MSAPSTALLQVQDLSLAFETRGIAVPALEGVSFDLHRGRTLALVGESGSGKSTIANVLMGLLPENAKVTGGSARLAARGGDPAIDLTALNPKGAAFRRLRGTRMAMVFQEPMTALSPVHTIGDQVGEVVRAHTASTKDEALLRARIMLERVGFPDPQRALSQYPFELSGGLRQRAVIAMALVGEPDILIADEPTTALDVTIQAQILYLLKDLQAEFGMGLLLITHDLGVVANLADDMSVLYRGRVVESGPAAALFAEPKHPYLKALIAAAPRYDMGEERLSAVRSIASDTEGYVTSSPQREGAKHGPVLYRAEDVCKVFQNRKEAGVVARALGAARVSRPLPAVNGVSLEVRRGECLGIVGESGSGKSTLARLLMRAVMPTSGRIEFDDHGTMRDLAGLSGKDLKAFRTRIQYVFQDPMSALNPRMTVWEILKEPLQIHGLAGTDETGKPAYAERIRELVALVGLDMRFCQRYPHAFSGGQRQRIGIARALALRPEALLLDEPTSALDVSVQAQILNLLRDLRTALGLTYIFVSHNLAVVDYISDRIAVMCRGRIVEIGPRAAIFHDARHPYTQALLSAAPMPDPSRPLDLKALSAGKASKPEAWDKPYRLSGAAPGRLMDLGLGHKVLVGDPDAASPASSGGGRQRTEESV